MFDIRSHRHTVRVIAAWISVIVGIALGSGAIAQSADSRSSGQKKFGTVVTIDGGGGEIKAFGARVSVDGANARVKAAGAVVDVRGVVDGNVWAAGADVSIAAQVGASVRATGARVAVRGRMAGDVMAAGAIVDVDVATKGSVRAFGANVRVGALASIEGSLTAAGANVVFDGHVAGDAELAGAVVTINGRADANMSVHAEELFIGPNAIVSGDLFVRSLREPTIDPAATISGEIVREAPVQWFEDLPEISAAILAAVFAVSILVTGIFLLIFARSTFGEAVDHFRFRPLSTALYGIVAILVLVALSAVLMASVVAFGLGIALLLLLPIILVVSQPVAAAGIVGWVFGRNAPRLGVTRLVVFLIVGSAIIGLATIIPVTGPWIVVAVMIFGIGGFLRATLWRFRSLIKPEQGRNTVSPSAGLGQGLNGL